MPPLHTGHSTKPGESVEPKCLHYLLIDWECHLIPAGRWPVHPAETCIHGLVQLLLWGLEIKRQHPKQMQNQARLLAGNKKEQVEKEAGRTPKRRAGALADAGRSMEHTGELRLSWYSSFVVNG